MIAIKPHDDSLLDGGALKVRNYKYRIYPTQAQQEHFAKVFGSARYVWNKILAQSVESYQLHQENPELHNKQSVTPYDLSKQLTRLKQTPELEWLYDVSKGPLQQSVYDLGDAYGSFFKKRTGFPKFKSKHGKQSAYYAANCFTLKHGQIRLAKVPGALKLRGSKITAAQLYGCRVTKTPTGKYYLTISALVEIKRRAGSGVVGVDLGIKDLAVLSTGEKIANPKHFARAQKQLKRAQQALSRKRKGSCNRTKARIKVAKLHERVSNSRNDFQHKLSRQLVNENQVIAVEKLMVANMVKNRKLAKHISDASWSSFTNMLNYKAVESKHCAVFYVNTWFPSSHLCHVTHERLDRKLSLSERYWDCPYCGQRHDRDVNAAINILHEAETTVALNYKDHGEIAGAVVLSNAQ